MNSSHHEPVQYFIDVERIRPYFEAGNKYSNIQNSNIHQAWQLILTLLLSMKDGCMHDSQDQLNDTSQ